MPFNVDNSQNPSFPLAIPVSVPTPVLLRQKKVNTISMCIHFVHLYMKCCIFPSRFSV